MGAGAGEGAGGGAPQGPYSSRWHLRPQQGPLVLLTVAAHPRVLLGTAERPGTLSSAIWPVSLTCCAGKGEEGLTFTGTTVDTAQAMDARYAQGGLFSFLPSLLCTETCFSAFLQLKLSKCRKQR